jgi:hypothetical protein
VATTKFDQSDLDRRPALASYSLGRQWKQLTDGLVRTRSRVATSVFWHCRKIAGGAHRTAFLCDTSRISEGEGETGRQALQAQSGDLQGLPVFGSVGLDGLILKAWMGLEAYSSCAITPSRQVIKSGQNVTSYAKRQLRPRQHALLTTPSTKRCAPIGAIRGSAIVSWP